MWNNAAVHSQPALLCWIAACGGLKLLPRLFPMDSGGEVQRPSLAGAFGLVWDSHSVSSAVTHTPTRMRQRGRTARRQHTNPNAPARAACGTTPPSPIHNPQDKCHERQ
jgi:hypothetical protein